MGILDEAIKEHLELKRQHGADASELKQLEDEAFGAAERPGGEDAPDAAAEAPTEFMQQPDVAEPTDAPPEAVPESEEETKPASRTELADLQEPPAPPEDEAPPEPAEEESPAMEHEAVPEPAAEPEPSGSHSTSEREAIAEHPTEMYDVETELGSSESRAPSDEELAEEELDEPRLAPVDPLPETDAEDFFDEQRLSDELDQALEAPAEADDAADEVEAGDEAEDVLEETPDFLEEAPEDDRLWFEQKPPKDFDFDD